MALRVSKDTDNHLTGSDTLFEGDFPGTSQLETVEQKQRFAICLFSEHSYS